MADLVSTTNANLVPVPAAELLGYDDIQCTAQTLARTELVLKEGNLFLLTDKAGNVHPPGACELGLFYEDTRTSSTFGASNCSTSS